MIVNIIDMIIKITTDETFDPINSTIEVNGNIYKNVEGFKLIIAKDSNGNLTIQHSSGYLEAYEGGK